MLSALKILILTFAMLLTAVAAALLLPAGPRTASAQSAEVSSSLSAQSYTLQSPYGSPTVRRRRFTETFRHERMTEQLRALYEKLLAE